MNVVSLELPGFKGLLRGSGSSEVPIVDVENAVDRAGEESGGDRNGGGPARPSSGGAVSMLHSIAPVELLLN